MDLSHFHLRNFFVELQALEVTTMGTYLEFKDFHSGKWHCGGDYPVVYLTHVYHWGTGFEAFVWMSNVNIDYDGSPTAYGPPGKITDDFLVNAGPGAENGWFGVKSLKPKVAADLRNGPPKRIRPLVDDKNAPMDRFGRYPVVQQEGEPNPGHYVSSTSVPADTNFEEWDQRRWVNSKTYPYGAISGKLRDNGGVTLNDFGLAIRLDRFDTHSGFCFKDSGGDKSWAVGECSEKVFWDLGGVGRDNNFRNVFLVFPNSKRYDGNIQSGIGQFLRMFSLADNRDDLPMLLAYCGMAGKGGSGYQLWMDYQKKTDVEKVKIPRPPAYLNIVNGLRAWGYTGYPGF